MSAHTLLTDGLIAEYEPPATANGDALIPDRSPAIFTIKTTAAETRTLPAPLNVGQRITITLAVDGGDCVITASAGVNQTGNTVITLGDAGDTIELVAVQLGDNLVWRVTANDGATLS